jgi:hypothetical protein
MKNDTISNIFNPSEYLKEMADEETGRDEREPYQLELPKEINELRLKLDEVYALINRIWGAR